jgi:antitoxin (DNA-binding transcriptional repressor) of toxin-antitoxin stability system
MVDMADNGKYISVEAKETDLGQLLKRVRTSRRPIRIFSRGKPVADLLPVVLKRFGPPDPKLSARLLVKGHELTTAKDWRG